VIIRHVSVLETHTCHAFKLVVQQGKGIDQGKTTDFHSLIS
jgi:hypothetical protein